MHLLQTGKQNHNDANNDSSDGASTLVEQTGIPTLSSFTTAELFARGLSHSSETTSSKSSTPTASNQIEATGGVNAGATATISADTPQGTCVMDNDLSDNQQASWTESIVNTCCTGAEVSTCWYRVQAKVDPSVACKIPHCNDLFRNDQDRMYGFMPLSSANGVGKYQNVFPILFLSAGARSAIPLLLFLAAPLGVSLLLLL